MSKAQELASQLELLGRFGTKEAAQELRRLDEAHDWQYKMAGDRLRRIEKLEREKEELLEALKIIEQDARVARPYVGQVSRLGGIARAAIQKHEGGAT